LAYCEKYVGEDFRKKLQDTPEAISCIKRYRKSVVFVITPKQECMVDDGTRMVPKLDELMDLHIIICKLLNESGIYYTELNTANLEERVSTATKIVLSALHKKDLVYF
jgi:nicotinamide riboside kinase